MCFQQVICDVSYRDEFIVHWCVQLRKNRSEFSNLCSAQRKKIWWRKILLCGGQQKVHLLGGWLTLVLFVSFFLVGAINMFSELIHPLLKLPNCVLKQQPHILQLSEVLGSAFSLFEKQEWALLGYCHIHSFLIFQKTRHYTRKQCSRLLYNYWIQRSPQDSKPSANNSTCYSLAKSITGCIKFTKRAELWRDFGTLTTFLKPLVKMNLLYGKWTVGFFSLASQAGALHQHEALMLLLLYSKPILRKNRLFCSLLLPVYMHFLFSLFYSHSSVIYLSIHFSFIYSYFLFNWSFASDSESKWWWGMKICTTNSQIPLNPPLLHSVEQQYEFFNIPPLSDWVGLVKLL